jgi:hypothetical protein
MSSHVKVTLTILRPLGDASTAITIDGPSLRFRLTRPPGAGNTATFCKASGALGRCSFYTVAHGLGSSDRAVMVAVPNQPLDHAR